MFSRRSDLTTRQRPPRRFSTRRVSDHSPPRPPSATSYAVSVARSSRSGASSITGDESSVVDSVTLPLTLFEYGFPPEGPEPLPLTEVFTDPEGAAYLSTEAGFHLRALEREQTRTVYQYIRRSVRLAGARLLVLGSGSSKSTASLLSRGVVSATFVDTSAPALASLKRSVNEMGLDAAVDAEYVHDDAWSFLEGLDTEEYDIIIALKCVGLVLSSGPGRTIPALLDMVADALAPDGSFITNHHAAFATPEWDGKPVAVGMPRELYDLATIGGRYAQDVGYSWDVSHPDLDAVARFSSAPTDHMVQTWHTFHFRARHPRDGPKLGGNYRVVKTRAPTAQQVVAPAGFNEVVDAMIPVNNRGVKRIPVPSDISSFDVTRVRPKFDGHPAIAVLDGNSAVVLSPTRSFALGLEYAVEPPLVVAVEVVTPREGGVVMPVTGVISIGDTPTDPNDLMALESVSRVLRLLGGAGFFPSLPGLTQQLRGDNVVLPGPNGRDLHLPTDGINVETNGLCGVFIKTARGHTIDAKAADLGPALDAASTALMLTGPHGYVTAPGDDVWEYARDLATNVWTPVRRRTDKTFSDTPGAVLHTVLASLAAQLAGFVGTTEDVARKAAN